MDINDCIKFASENPVCYFATIAGDQPRVRAFGLWFADETGFYFQTSSYKETPHQLLKNPNAEFCFYKHSGMIGTMLRITGKAEFIDDIKLKERALTDRPFLKTFGLTVDSPGLILFKIAHGHAHFWTMENNLKAKEIIKF